MADLQVIADCVIKGDRDAVSQMVQQALDEQTHVSEVLEQGLIAGMAVVGARFKANEVYVPEVLIAARAMKAGMALLEPLLKEAGVEPVGKVVLGTVKGDLHDIGKNLVGMMLQGAGFEVVDLGTDVPAETFLAKIDESGAKVLAMSALLTTTMPQMAEVVKAVKEAGVDVKTMIGGAPVTQSYCDEIGANGYAPDAASAADLALEMVG